MSILNKFSIAFLDGWLEDAPEEVLNHWKRIRETVKSSEAVAEPASLGAEAPKKFPLLFSDDWLRSTVPSDPEGEPMAGGTTSRFYIDHGAIHDRKTGQHVGMDAEPESVERLLALLQELELQHQPIKAEPASLGAEAACPHRNPVWLSVVDRVNLGWCRDCGAIANFIGDATGWVSPALPLPSGKLRGLVREAADALGYLDEFYDVAEGGPVTPKGETPAELADRLEQALLSQEPSSGAPVTADVEPAPPVQEAPRDWQLITTAPKTGEHILVAEFNSDRIGFGFCGGKKQSMMTVVHWWDNPGEEGWYASVDSQGEHPFPATHWKPLDEI